MLGFANSVVRGRFGQALLLVALLYFASVPITVGPMVAEILNLVALALCAAVGFVYFPDFTAALRSQRPTQGDWLGAGICIGWLSSAALKADGEAVALGYLDALTSVHHGFLILMQIIGAICHLVAPHAQQERVRRQASIVIGMTVGIACAIGAGLFEARYLHVIKRPVDYHDAAPVVEKQNRS